MTVAGKGGRPRRWRSDADRVRAYRARQRGDDEPATLDQALDDGDHVARLIARTKELQAELADTRRTERELHAQVDNLQRELEALRARVDWLGGQNDVLRDERQRLITERDALADARIERVDHRPTAARPVQLPRAERRRIERETKRRGEH